MEYLRCRDAFGTLVRVQKMTHHGKPRVWIFCSNDQGIVCSPNLTRRQAKRIAEALLAFVAESQARESAEAAREREYAELTDEQRQEALRHIVRG